MGGLIPGYLLEAHFFEPESWSWAPGCLAALGDISNFLPTSVPERAIAVKIRRDVRDLREAVVGFSSSGRKWDIRKTVWSRELERATGNAGRAAFPPMAGKF